MIFPQANRTVLIALLLVTIALISCNKENEETDYNDNIIAARSNVKAEGVYTDIFNMFYKASINEDLFIQGTAIIDTATVIFDSIPQLKIKVDYGSYFRLCPDGLVRKGSYTAILSDMPDKPGSIASLTFEDYISQDLLVEGNLFISYVGDNASGFPVFQYSLDNGVITHLIDSIVSSTFSWKCLKDLILIDGKQTPTFADDDIFVLSGSANGVAINGKAFETEISSTNPLINDLSCNWIVAGLQNITTPDLEITSGSIDYITDDDCNSRIAFYFNQNVFYFRPK